MIKKLKSYLLIITSMMTMAVPLAVPVVVHGASCGTNIADQVAKGAGDAAKDGGGAIQCAEGEDNTNGIASVAQTVVNIFSYVVGAIAIIMIIYGGFRYITSGGSSEGVGTAKNTLIYAIVGLVIVALAQIIVRFVLSTSSDAVGTGTS